MHLQVVLLVLIFFFGALRRNSCSVYRIPDILLAQLMYNFLIRDKLTGAKDVYITGS